MSQFAFSSLQRKFLLACVALILSALVFACAQNVYGAPGGKISLPKLLWLLCAISIWFILPIFLASDRRSSYEMRRVSWIFAANMFCRGLIELWMMFVSRNWSPYYGIAHDMFSMCLIAATAGLIVPQSAIDKVVRHFYAVIFFMFPFEIFFAWYMKTVVQQAEGAHLYYVPDVPAYALVLSVTWIAVLWVIPAFIILSKRWLRA